MSDTFNIFFELHGDPKNPCLILINGIGGQLIHWTTEFIHALVNKKLYVVIFDNRDSGLSKHYNHFQTRNLNEAISAIKTGKFEPPYTLDHMAEDVIFLMDKLNIQKAHIAGCSMGGMIAQLVAINHPTRVLSLICMITSSGETSLPQAKEEVLNYFFSPKKQTVSCDDFLDSKMQLHKIYNHPDHIDEKKDRALFQKSYHRSHNPAGFTRQLLAMIVAKPRTEKLKQLKIPTLIIHGNNDPVFSIEHAKQLQQCVPSSQLTIIEKMGHGLPDCLSEEIANLIVKHIYH